MKNRLLSLVMALAMICGFATLVPELDLKASAANWIWPVTGGVQGCGLNCTCSTHGGNHDGQDIIAATGTPVVAASSGTVICAYSGDNWKCSTCDMNGAGKHVEIQHENSLKSVYCHMNSVTVSVGQSVSAGQQIGTVGATGYATGAHLHFMIAKGNASHAYWGNNYFVNPLDYINPNNSGTKPAKPTWAKVTVPKSTFAVGEEITFTLTSDTGKAYTIGIDNSDGERIHTYNWYFGSESTTQYYKYTINKSGNYSCYISAINDIGLCDSERIYFSVATKPSWAKVSLPKSTFNAGEEMTFTLTSDTGKSYTIGIDDSNGNRIHTYNFYFGTESTTQYYKYNIKEPGNYSCYISAINDIGLCDSERIYFSIAGKPLWAKVSVPKSQFIHGEEIEFTLSSDYGKSYTIGIDNEDGKRIHTYNFYFGSGSTTQIYKYKLDKIGEYSCYITAINDIGLCDSDRIYFNVGHNWNNPTYIWSSDYKTCTATRSCAYDISHKETETVNTSYAVTNEATETSEGTGKYTAKFTNTAFETKTKTVTIPALSHTHEWGAPTYSWSSDYKTCTATRVCTKDSSHKEIETVNASYAVTTEPTETVDGVGKYTAKFTNTAFATKTKTVTIPALSHTHNWGEPTYSWSSDHRTCTATRVCTLNSSHTETETVNSSSTVKTPATCSVKGTTTYTAIFTNKAFANQTKDVQDIEVKEHTWSEWKTTAFDVTKGTSTQTRTCSTCNETESRTTENAIQRLAGSGRYETAAKISQAAFDQAETVVLAYGLNYADALAGVSLAKAMNAPILLTNLKTLPAETLAEIKRLKAKNVIILGGTGAVGAEVETALIKEGFKTERIAGATRFETATKISEKMQKLSGKAPEEVFFVYAFNSADALSVSPIAASKNAPIIYLTTKGELNADTAAYLAKLKKAGSVKNAYVIGGESVISNDMATKAAKALGLSKATRIAGANRFATCVAVNEKFADVLDGDLICVATGMDFPDALAGGVYAAINKAPLFLINGKLKTPKLTNEQKAYLKIKAAAKITAFGGVSVVPDNHIADIVKNSI